MGSHQPIRKIVAPDIPDKLYFRIGDVARICEVPAYVLRFWETEFPQLKPNKGGTGQRLYRKRDVEMALRIKSLLYDQGYTIPGARQFLKGETKPKEPAATVVVEPPPPPEPFAASFASPLANEAADPGAALRRQAQFRDIRNEMRALLAELSAPVGKSQQAGTSRLQPMRPRLMLEPRPVRPEAPRLQLAQRDLFALDSREFDSHEPDSRNAGTRDTAE